MKKKRKKITKGKKKFFIIASCYFAVFLVTFLTTLSTLSWYSSSTWSTKELFMGGPVYIDFTNKDGSKVTSGKDEMVLTLPPNWDKLYPGMNIHLEASCTVQGAKWEKPKNNGDTVTVVTTGAILRAKVMVTVTDPKGNIYPGTAENPEDLAIAKSLYNNIWPQLQYRATNKTDSVGKWIYDTQNNDDLNENYFYYISKDSSAPLNNSPLVEVGGVEEDVLIDFLSDTIITLDGLGFINDHADCKIEFTIVFHALQAFLPYEEKDLGTPYQGNTTDRENIVTTDDLGLPKPLTIGNAREPFARAFSAIYPGN